MNVDNKSALSLIVGVAASFAAGYYVANHDDGIWPFSETVRARSNRYERLLLANGIDPDSNEPSFFDTAVGRKTHESHWWWPF